MVHVHAYRFEGEGIPRSLCRVLCVWLQDLKAAFVCELQQVRTRWSAQVAARGMAGGER